MNLLYSVAVTIFITVQVAAFEVQWRETRKSPHTCLAEGRFQHPNQCGVYVECIRNTKNGLFKKRFGDCHGAIFSAESKSCIPADEDEECKRRHRSARALPMDIRFSNLCNNERNGFFCADCKTLTKCIEGVAFTEACGAGDTCSERSDFGGAVCYPTPEANCTCTNPNEFLGDPYNQQMFFFCSDQDVEPEMHQCSGDMEFDVLTQQCKNPNGLPPCTNNGVFAYIDDCSQYYKCISSRTGWVQKAFSCGNDMMYNELTSNCEDPCTWNTGLFTCQQEGRFPDPLSCDSYHECIQLPDGSFRQEQRYCPKGHEWDATALSGRGICVRGTSSNCNIVEVSKCIIPDRCSGVSDGECAATGNSSVNIALGKTTNSVQVWHQPTLNTAAKAVDGIETPDNYFHSMQQLDKPWWFVDLGENRLVKEVHVLSHGSTIHYFYFKSIEIRIGKDPIVEGDFSNWDLFAYYEGPTPAAVHDQYVEFSANTTAPPCGRYVSIQKMGATPNEYLAFNEVKVFAL